MALLYSAHSIPPIYYMRTYSVVSMIMQSEKSTNYGEQIRYGDLGEIQEPTIAIQT